MYPETMNLKEEAFNYEREPFSGSIVFAFRYSVVEKVDWSKTKLPAHAIRFGKSYKLIACAELWLPKSTLLFLN